MGGFSRERSLQKNILVVGTVWKIVPAWQVTRTLDFRSFAGEVRIAQKTQKKRMAQQFGLKVDEIARNVG
jgi:abortive infection bacteriophage resistance protein